jgi:hypothetical protein
MWSWPTSVPESIAALKDLALAGAGIATAIVAARGLSTWQRQLRGSADFDCARSIAMSAYKVRDTTQACRSPWIDGREFPPEYADGSTRKTAEQEAQAMAFVYRNRWKPVVEAMRDLDREARFVDVRSSDRHRDLSAIGGDPPPGSPGDGGAHRHDYFDD